MSALYKVRRILVGIQRLSQGTYTMVFFPCLYAAESCPLAGLMLVQFSEFYENHTCWYKVTNFVYIVIQLVKHNSPNYLDVADKTDTGL